MSNPFEELTQHLARVEEKVDKLFSQLKIKGSGQSEQSEKDELLNTLQASKLLGISIATTYGKIHRQTIPFHKPPGSKRVYFYKNELLEFVRSGVIVPPGEKVEERKPSTKKKGAKRR